MNLDTQDIELIRSTVAGAVAEATSKLVTKDEFKDFRAEVLVAQTQFVSREVFTLELKQRDEAIERLAKQVADNKNVLAHLWENTGVRVGAALALILQAWELWRIFN
jgi:hypothetical protein